MRVEEIMTRDPRCCAPQDDVSTAARIMWEQDCGVVPVVDDEGAPVGMITDRDICMAAYTRGAKLSDMSIETVMSRDVRTCRASDPIGSAERVMANAQVRRLAVVDDRGRVIGVVSLGDLARSRRRSPIRRTVEHLFADVARTLAAISQPRAERPAP
ncbi:CBS domain-containing protein [Sandaracinus amylolyticus]|uniref:CBS domain protein n=1 Tax=Sandaracinus amylolyticus TaxID=927083 RepID=A0A0F6YEY6_9BACT|nr:CBS domain-containing protein [Sandaracinus amylolyticus]AKF02938.1 CBS domain protein [Sandaracinus amylolyticus]